MPHILLSICIPTYNRGPLLCLLVRSVLENLPPGLLAATEIVISDNHSTDQTGKLLSAEFGFNPRVRIVQPERHLPTAEENLCFAVSQCQGEYVWSLGDDDAVERQTLITLQRLLEAGSHDFLVFNSRSISSKGISIGKIRVPCLSPIQEMDLLDFVRATGFWFVIAGFSTTVFRRRFANLEEFRNIMEIGRIYSHVIWQIACYHNRRFSFVNQPIVSYRQNPSDEGEGGHWEEVQKREGTFDGGLWSVCFLRQIDYLVSKRVIDRSYLKDISDRNMVGRFYLPDAILGHFLRGLRNDIVDKQSIIPESEVSYFLDWARVFWNDNIILLSLLDEVVKCKREKRMIRHDLANELKNIFESRSAMRWFEHFHLYDAHGYSVFLHGKTWFAIRLGGYEEASDLLEILDFDDWQDLLCVRASEAEVLTWVEKQWRLASATPSATCLSAPPRQLANLRTVNLSTPAQGPANFNAREIANAIRSRAHWRFNEWFRLVRALNFIAVRSVLKAVGLRR